VELEAMQLRNTDGSVLMTVNEVSKDGQNLVVDGVLMDSMPVRCVLTPSDARRALPLLKPRTIWLLLTILFRP
jgi:hypothetical protein